MSASPSCPPLSAWRALVERALAEDVGSGDITSSLTIPADARGSAQIEAREDVVVCGLSVAEEVFRQVDPRLAVERQVHEGDRVSTGTPLLIISGSVRSILTASAP